MRTRRETRAPWSTATGKQEARRARQSQGAMQVPARHHRRGKGRESPLVPDRYYRLDAPLPRISHQRPAVDADPTASAALNVAKVLNVLSSTSARLYSRSPCRYRPLRALASCAGEKCGLRGGAQAITGATAPDRRDLRPTDGSGRPRCRNHEIPHQDIHSLTFTGASPLGQKFQYRRASQIIPSVIPSMTLPIPRPTAPFTPVPDSTLTTVPP